jgi:S1-C subfamily serine protease
MAAAAPLEQSVVRLTVSKRPVDPAAPWQFDTLETQSHLAMLVEGAGAGRMLTTAFAVADATFIEFFRFGDSRKFTAEVAFFDYEANLALIEPASPADQQALMGMVPLPLGDEVNENAKLDVYPPRDNNQLSKLSGTLQEVGIFTAVTSNYSLLSYLIKVQQSGLGWAEPVMENGKLVAMTSGQDSNYLHAIPAPIIRHFLTDDQFNYRGFASIGVELSPLTAPPMRGLLKADKYAGGVRVAKVAQDSGFFGILRTDDVILAVDGVPVSDLGYYTHPRWGKLHLKYLVNKRYGGDPCSLRILRAGAEMTVTGKLTRFLSNNTPVIHYRYGEPVPHVIFGGFVFQELSRDYLRQWGKDWRDLAPFDLLYQYEADNEPLPDGSRRIVLLSRVLADDFNRGYDDLRNAVVQVVNGRPVTSLVQLVAALREAPLTRGGKRFARFELARDNGEVVVGYDDLEAANARIAKTYEVNKPESFFK